MAIQFKWTNQKGSVDQNSRYLHDINEKYADKQVAESVSQQTDETLEIFRRIDLLNQHYPTNAQYIIHALNNGDTITEISRMLDAVDLALKENQNYQRAVEKLTSETKSTKTSNKSSAFEWMNIPEWEVFKEAVVKDKHLIDSVAKVTGESEVPRLKFMKCLIHLG